MLKKMLDKVMELVGGGSVINGAFPSVFFTLKVFINIILSRYFVTLFLIILNYFSVYEFV